MKQATLSNRSLGNFFKVCSCICMVTVVAWSGYNTHKMKTMTQDSEASMTELKLQLNARDVAMQQIHQQVKNVEERAVEHRILRRSIPERLNDSGKVHVGGATYTRWGRTTCGPDSELVYDGHVGGSWYDHPGGASNLICLPKRPLWKKGGGCSAYVYGAEYEESNQFLSKNYEGNLVNQNMPCAVCRSAMRSSHLMIPARNVCYPGWSLEYQGYLMTGHHGHKNNYDYVCVDEAPEGDPAGYRDENGAMLYGVCAQCGSLPCPSYINGKALTCAVCTK